MTTCEQHRNTHGQYEEHDSDEEVEPAAPPNLVAPVPMPNPALPIAQRALRSQAQAQVASVADSAASVMSMRAHSKLSNFIAACDDYSLPSQWIDHELPRQWLQ